MDELARRLAVLREEVAPPWNDARTERARLGVARLQRRHKLKVRAATGASTLAIVGLVAWQVFDTTPTTRSLALSPQAESPAANPSAVAALEGSSIASTEPLPMGTPVHLADGSLVTVASADSQLFLEHNQAQSVRLRLASGTAHFEVVPNTQREFSVVSGAISVIVVGTAFDVERTQNRVRVAVLHGKVRVHSFAGDAFVQTGESRWFEQSPVADPALAPNARSVAPVKREAVHKAPVPIPAPIKERAQIGWRTLNQSGDYEGAYALLEKGAAVDDDAEALMEAADAARLTGHLETAVRYLRNVVSNHRSDPATPLAAFTLGRVLLERLGRPSEAAEAFAAALELAPDGSLGQDALAREVEAWSKAGHSEEAYLRARMFVERFPDSRRRRVVQLYGGLGAQ